MQAIETRFFGPTETRGSRIRASCEGGSLYVPYDHALDREANHREACKRLCEKLCWDSDRFFGGWLASGQYAWVPVFTYDWEQRQKEVANAGS